MFKRTADPYFQILLNLSNKNYNSNNEKHFLLKTKDQHSSKALIELSCYKASIQKQYKD